VKGFGTDESSGFPYMIMPYKSGGTLIEQIQKGPLPFDKVMKYVWQLAQALTYAHKRNIIHRDIKPANVLLDEDDQVSLADFSIAKLFNLSTTTLTSANQMLGTPAYMAPEQVSNHPISPATDVYELGVLTYQLITGCLPFDVSTLLALLQRIVQDNPPPPHGIRLDLPAAASTVLFKAMEKKQEARYSSAEDFALALEQSMQEVLSTPLIAHTIQAVQDQEQLRALIASYDDEDDEQHNLTYANDAPTIAANYSPFALEDIQASIIPVTYDIRPTNTGPTARSSATLDQIADAVPKSLTHKQRRLVPLTLNKKSPLLEDRSPSSSTNQSAAPAQDTHEAVMLATDTAAHPEEIPTTPLTDSSHETKPMITSQQKAVRPAEREDVATLAIQLARLRSSVYPTHPEIDDSELDSASHPSLPGIDTSDVAHIATSPLPPSIIHSQSSKVRATVVKAAPQPGPKRPLPQIIIASILVILLIGGGIFMLNGRNLALFTNSIQATPTPLPPSTSAIISITPDSKTLQKTFTISAVTGLPDTNQHQVLARWISGNPAPQQRTVNSTGKVATPAAFASGTLLFTNKSTIGAVQFAAGAKLTSTGKTHIQVILDEAVNLPPVLATNPNQNPMQRVRAHFAKGGAAGNVAAQQFSLTTGACLPTAPICYTAVNDAPFIGGTDAQNFMFVQQVDIDGAAKALLTLAPDPQQVLKDQMSGNEQWIVTPSCRSQTSANHVVGDKAADVTATVSFFCTGEVYDKKGALETAKQELKDTATNDAGNSYALSGTINATLQSAQITDPNGTVKVTVDTKGLWVFQLDPFTKEEMAKALAGKNKLTVQKMLKDRKSIKNASIELNGGDQNTFPTNPQQITINMQPADSK